MKGVWTQQESLGENFKQIMCAAYGCTRSKTEQLCEPLEVEDCVVQSMALVSPIKWHLAHTSWFFEQFILKRYLPNYQPLHEQYEYLFNSYYNAVGPQHCQSLRGLLSRPTVSEIYAYRKYVDEQMIRMMLEADEKEISEIKALLAVGINHEQQHQELILTDIKHIFSSNPMLPIYHADQAGDQDHRYGTPMRWVEFDGGLYEIGYIAKESHRKREGVSVNLDTDRFFQTSDGLASRALVCSGFTFDNERPGHRAYVNRFAMADRLVTNGEYLGFIEDDGYHRPEFWLSEGWQQVVNAREQHPLYWYEENGAWKQYTLHGPRLLATHEPVCHLSYFEADAFARWSGFRLPTEQEWEVAASFETVGGNLMETKAYHPLPAQGELAGTEDTALDDLLRDSVLESHLPIRQCFGDVWEWTQSAYSAYPGYRQTGGALGEYNGKFMCNQFVLRGGSCATPTDHIRATYRNFWAPETRWQFTGIRLARDLG